MAISFLSPYLLFIKVPKFGDSVPGQVQVDELGQILEQLRLQFGQLVARQIYTEDWLDQKDLKD